MDASAASALEVENAKLRSEGEAMIAEMRARLGPEPAAEILTVNERLPPECRNWPAARMFQFFRCRLRLTQSEVASLAGLAPSQISRLEGGSDCLLSTWRRAYYALGLDFTVLPRSDRTIEELERKVESRRVSPRKRSLRPHGPWFR